MPGARAPRRAEARRAEAARAARLVGGGETEVRGWRALAPTFLPGAVRRRSFFSVGAPPVVLSSPASPPRTYFPIEDCVVLQATGISPQSSGGQRSPGTESKSSMGRWLPRRGWLGRDGLARGLNVLPHPHRPFRSHPGAHACQTEERRGVVGRALALPDDAGAPAALSTCHLAAGIQSPDPLIDFRGGECPRSSGWDSVTRPLDRLRKNSGERCR